MAIDRRMVQSLFALTLGPAFVWVGIQHFVNPAFFEPIVPAVLGNPPFWVYASGVVEIALGAGMIVRSSRRIAGYSTAAFLVVLYWANLNMWLNEIPLSGTTVSTPAHIARAIAQLVMIAMAVWIAQRFDHTEQEGKKV